MTCDAGKAAGIQQDICETCVTGKIPDGSKAACVSCAGGQYRDTSDYTCKDCAIGTASAALVDICPMCVEGQYTSGLGLTACTDCAPGKYLEALTLPTAITECKTCGAGDVSTASKATICTLCGSGQVPNTDKKACEACGVGTYKSGAACATCDAGKYSWWGTTVSCKSCPESSNSVAGSSRSGCLCNAGFYGTFNSFLSPEQPAYKVVEPWSQPPSSSFAGFRRQDNVVVLLDKLFFPSTVSDGVLFQIGGASNSLFAAVRDSSTGSPVLRVRSGVLDSPIAQGTLYGSLVYLDISNFPKDDQVDFHTHTHIHACTH